MVCQFKTKNYISKLYNCTELMFYQGPTLPSSQHQGFVIMELHKPLTNVAI